MTADVAPGALARLVLLFFIMTLYYRLTCRFCRNVLNAANDLGITLDLRNIDTESERKELLRLGGKIQVPYLFDEKSGIRMYESGDIIRYLQESKPSS